MLVLTRRLGQKIMAGDSPITVVAFGKKFVRIQAGSRIFSLRVGEGQQVYANVFVTLVDVRFGQIKLGIKAPNHIAIHREEIYQKIKEELAA